MEAVNSSGSAFSGADWGYTGNSVTTLRTALDNTSLSFSSGGGTPWWGNKWGESYDGTDAAHSGKIDDGRSSWMTTTVSGPGTLSFWWKVSCENGKGWYDYLEVLVDGRRKDRIKGETDWTYVRLEITGTGKHDIKWNFRKDGISLDGSDCGWVDRVKWKSDNPWTDEFFKVSFDANGGEGSMAKQKIPCGQAAKLRKNAFTRQGWTFLGWSRTKTGAVAFKNAQSVKDLAKAGRTVTLYARWAKKTYKIAFYANGGTGKMSAQKMTYGKAAKLKANKFKREGYVFKGWAKSKALANAGKVAYKNGKTVKNLVKNGKTVKLYAVWKKK